MVSNNRTKSTVDEGTVEPPHVVALREAEQHLVGQDRNGQQQHGARGDGQRERAQPQPGGGGGRDGKQQHLGERLGSLGVRQQRQRVQAKGRATRL